MHDPNYDYSVAIIGKWRLVKSVLYLNNSRYVAAVKSDNFFVQFYSSGKAYWQETEFEYSLSQTSIFCSDAVCSKPEMKIITLDMDSLILKIPVINAFFDESYYLEHFERMTEPQKTT